MHQTCWHLESVNEFTNQMKAMLEEAKAAILKDKDNVARYYNQHQSLTLTYKPGNQVFLDTLDIHTTWPSKKLAHHWLSPFTIEKKVRTNFYQLQLLMKRLHPFFNVIKLMLAPDDPIPGRHSDPPCYQNSLMEKNTTKWNQYWIVGSSDASYNTWWNGKAMEWKPTLGKTLLHSKHQNAFPTSIRKILEHLREFTKSPHPNQCIEVMLIWGGGNCKGNTVSDLWCSSDRSDPNSDHSQ